MQASDFAPTVPTDEQAKMIREVNAVFQLAAEDFINLVPSSAHRTAALRKLLEAKMTLIHGITHP